MRMFTNGIGVSLGPGVVGDATMPPGECGEASTPGAEGARAPPVGPRVPPRLARRAGSGGDLDAVPWLHHVHLHTRRDGRDRLAELLAALDAQHLRIVGVVHRDRLRYARHLTGAGRVLRTHRVRPVAD